MIIKCMTLTKSAGKKSLSLQTESVHDFLTFSQGNNMMHNSAFTSQAELACKAYYWLKTTCDIHGGMI